MGVFTPCGTTEAQPENKTGKVCVYRSSHAPRFVVASPRTVGLVAQRTSYTIMAELASFYVKKKRREGEKKNTRSFTSLRVVHVHFD